MRVHLRRASWCEPTNGSQMVFRRWLLTHTRVTPEPITGTASIPTTGLKTRDLFPTTTATSCISPVSRNCRAGSRSDSTSRIPVSPPFSAYLTPFDFNGDGTTGDLLPGTTVNSFNRSLGRAGLDRLVTQFNTTYAGQRDSQDRLIPRLSLPPDYSLGDDFHSLDLRLSRAFSLGERSRWRCLLIGEVFNLYNNANLSGHSGDLTSAAFGKPTTRATQVFGSGGPRAFQLAMKVAF